MEAYDEAPYLLTRKAAATRYSISTRQLDEISRKYPEFPVLRVGRKVLIHREDADEWFSNYMWDVIAVD